MHDMLSAAHLWNGWPACKLLDALPDAFISQHVAAAILEVCMATRVTKKCSSGKFCSSRQLVVLCHDRKLLEAPRWRAGMCKWQLL